ncbi:DUF899 family protein [Phenylobacterium sp.]|uniref:DUF899 family protein n=1 Tax=Phenylobacterium sp. TaxID=1871053 RepID=UPI003FA71121
MRPWEGAAADVDQRISLVVVARSPIARLIAWKKERGWKQGLVSEAGLRRLTPPKSPSPARPERAKMLHPMLRSIGCGKRRKT